MVTHEAARRAERALMLGNFAVASGVMIVPGMLGAIAEGLDVSVPTAGQLITLAALVTCVSAPLAAQLTSQIDRRTLLVGALLLYVVGHAACAVAPTYAALAVLRGITVVAAAVFTPQAAATISVLVAPEHRSKAVAGVFLGFSVASVLAMPVANLLAAHLGWRWTFAVASLLSAVAAAWVAQTIPGRLSVPRLSMRSWGLVARSRLLTGILGVTLLSAAGQFTMFAYVAPALAVATGSSSVAVASLLGLFGFSGVAGNRWMMRHIARLGPDRAAARALGAMLVGVACSVLVAVAVATIPARWPVWVLLPAACLFWGLGTHATNSAQQARLAAAAPSLASASIALNTSGIYAGQAIGAGFGGLLIAGFGIGLLPFAALVLLLHAFGLSQRLRLR